MTTSTHHTKHATSSKPHPTHPVAPTSRLQLAFDRCKPEMDALQPADLVSVNVDLGIAITTVRGALPNIAGYRAQLADLPTLEVKRIDKLEDYALATAHAQGLYLTAVTPPESIPALAAEALNLRESLHGDAATLGRHGLIDGERIKGLRQGTGHKTLAFDLIGLVAVFRDGWAKVEGKTPTDPKTLDRAEVVADQLLGALGERETAPAVVAEISAVRQRAFTLLFRAYDDARRAISFLRWNEGDADSIVPSIYQGRGGRGRSVTTGDTASPATPVPAAPVGIHTAAAAEAPGLPGGSPFVS